MAFALILRDDGNIEMGYHGFLCLHALTRVVCSTLNSSSFHPVFSTPTSLDNLISYNGVSELSPKS